MKKKLIFISILTALFLIMCMSCKSTTPAQTPESPVRADIARKKAMDFDAPAYFPSEWEAAEKRYSAQEYEAAADAYDELYKKSVPLYAQAKEDELMAIREEIKASGFSDEYPAYLKSADEKALKAFEQYEAGDYYEAQETYDEAMEEYSALLVGARAYKARREIIDRGFTEYDKDNFNRADEMGNLALSKYDEGDTAGAVETAEEALLRYNIVLENGWTQYASQRRSASQRERELALAEKANIASRDFFREADVMFNQAEELFKNENFRDSGILYIDSEARFAVSRKDTEDKRIKAEEAIKLAEEKIEESEGTAAEAEKIIEGGAR